MCDVKVQGSLVSFPVADLDDPLNGFIAHGKRRSRRLLIFVHGLGGNFFKSRFKQSVMSSCPKHGWDVLSYNNRGNGPDGNVEKFTDCVRDIEAAISFGKRQGYREFVLMGHSTGCQKSTYYMDRKKDSSIKGLILAAASDDYAIIRTKLRSVYPRWMQRARELIEDGRGDDPIPKYDGMSPRRILSLGDKSRIEARLFDYDGKLTAYSKLKCPILAFFGAEDEYLCRSAEDIGDILEEKTGSERFEWFLVENADHGFHGHEKTAVRRVCRWLKQL